MHLQNKLHGTTHRLSVLTMIETVLNNLPVLTCIGMSSVITAYLARERMIPVKK